LSWGDKNTVICTPDACRNEPINNVVNKENKRTILKFT
jgi:hypothetical protein